MTLRGLVSTKDVEGRPGLCNESSVFIVLLLPSFILLSSCLSLPLSPAECIAVLTVVIVFTRDSSIGAKQKVHEEKKEQKKVR